MDKSLVVTPTLLSREKWWRERVLPRSKARHGGLGRARITKFREWVLDRKKIRRRKRERNKRQKNLAKLPLGVAVVWFQSNQFEYILKGEGNVAIIAGIWEEKLVQQCRQVTAFPMTSYSKFRRLLQFAGPATKVWLDALSINQADHEVAVMGDIHSNEALKRSYNSLPHARTSEGW
jgi:hypothetical protein